MRSSPASAETARRRPDDGRRWLAAILLASLVANALPLWWGLPTNDPRSWAFDEIPPQDLGLTVVSRHAGRYPPLHYDVLRTLYAPVRALQRAGVLELGPKELDTLLRVIGRCLSVLLGTATVYLVYRCGRLLFDRSAARLAAAAMAFLPPHLFYSKTTNLEAPYVFWFVLSLFFYLRILDRHRPRDYAAFAAAAALAACTKDQALALYVLPLVPLVVSLYRHRFGPTFGWRAAGRLLIDRRLLTALGVGVAIFAVVHRVLWDPSAFLRHLRVITGPASEPEGRFAATAAGQLRMAAQAGRHVLFSLGAPLTLAAAGGLVGALRHPSRHGRLLSLVAFPISYYAIFIMPIHYHRVRYFLPVCVVASLLAAGAWAALRARSGGAGRVGTRVAGLLFGLALVYTFLYGVSLDLEMLRDSRYRIESWLEEREVPPDEVALLGTHRQRLPRIDRLLTWERLAMEGPQYLRRRGPAHLVINPDEPSTDRERQLRDLLLAGELNYEPALRYRYRPPLDLFDTDGVSTNLSTVNPELVVLRRRQPWGRAAEEIYAEVVALPAAGEVRRRNRLAEEIVSAPLLDRRRRFDAWSVAFGLGAEDWTRGTEPAVLVVENPTAERRRPRLELTSMAPNSALPLTVSVDDGRAVHRYELRRRGRVTVPLAGVRSGGRRLYRITSDRAWEAEGSSGRLLGVRIRPLPLVEDPAADPAPAADARQPG